MRECISGSGNAMADHPHARTGMPFRRSLVVATAIALMLSARPGSAPPAAAEGGVSLTPGATIYFPSTGQSLSGPFLAYWIEHPEIGAPVSSQVQHGVFLTQWFEFARLELRGAPEETTAANVYRVALGQKYAEQIGYTTQFDAFAPKASGPDRFFPDTGHAIQNGFRAAYEQPGMPERLGPPISDEFSIRGVTYQFFQFGAFRWDPAAGARLVPLGRLDAWLNRRLGPAQPMPEGARNAEAQHVITLAPLLSGERWIEVDLSDHLVTAWVGDVPLLREKVITGSPNSPTVTGTFHIYLKNRIQDLDGIGWDGTPFSEPGVPWVMYFYLDYGFHGTTWRTSFGYADSQGCVVMPNDLARLLWEFAGYGTRVWIHQ